MAILLSVACSKTENNDMTQNGQSGLESQLIKNTWIVAYYEDRGKDETSDFNGYSIQFSADGSLLVSTGQAKAQYKGSWMLTGNSDDSSSSGGKLIMAISGNDVVRELEEDWRIIEWNETRLKLFDDSADHTAYLNLVRM